MGWRADLHITLTYIAATKSVETYVSTIYTTRPTTHFFAGAFAPGLDAALILVLLEETPGGKLLGAVAVVGFFSCGFGPPVAGFFAAPPTLLLTPVLGVAGFFAPAPPPVEVFRPCTAGLPAVGGPVGLLVGW